MKITRTEVKPNHNHTVIEIEARDAYQIMRGMLMRFDPLRTNREHKTSWQVATVDKSETLEIVIK